MVAAARLDSSPRSSAAAADASHTVQRGETLSSIARDAGVSLHDLIAANPQIANPDRIFAGERIQLPAANTSAGPGAAAAGGSSPAGMGLSADGLNLVKDFEGLRLSAYQDSAGVWTIGYGHTGNVHPGERITQGQAEQLLRRDTGWAQDAVRRRVHVPLTQGQFDSLTSFTFNLGAGALEGSTLLKKLNGGDYAGAQAEFGQWVHAGGQVLQGLVRRRASEAERFGGQAPAGGGSAAPAAPSTPAAGGGDYTVRRGDTLWDIARTHGVSLRDLIAANPQIANPDLIFPDQKIHLPAGARGGTVAPAAVAPSAPDDRPTGDAGGAAAIARRFVERNASELKHSGDLPMDGGVPSNICCANFVSAVLEKAGLLPHAQHTNSVDQLDTTLRERGWRPVDPAHAKPGDVVIIQGGGVSHTVMVESNENGRLRLVGSNNVNADGSQRVTVGSANWALAHGAVILAPPSN